MGIRSRQTGLDNLLAQIGNAPMTDDEIIVLAKQLRELARLKDPAFVAATETRRNCEKAAQALMQLLDRRA